MATTLCDLPPPGYLLTFVPPNDDVFIIYDSAPVRENLHVLVKGSH